MGRPRMGKAEFVKRAMRVHGTRYGYKFVEYKTNKDKVDILCMEHGLFKQTPQAHLTGSGCPKCYADLRRILPGPNTGKKRK